MAGILTAPAPAQTDGRRRSGPGVPGPYSGNARTGCFVRTVDLAAEAFPVLGPGDPLTQAEYSAPSTKYKDWSLGE